MYADDVILLSESKVGLQNCLKKLYRYCEVWCLDINIDKPITIILINVESYYHANFI